MASTIPPPYLNGSAVPPVNAQHYTEFYEKLLSLQKEVFAGKHPRIRLPESVLEQVSSRATQDVQASSTAQANGVTNNTASSANGTAAQDLSSVLFPPYTTNPGLPPIPTTTRPSSEIDPVLLTKSDVLIRSECALKRQRLERSLDDLVKAKKGQQRDKDNQEIDTRFDVEEILSQAHEIVKPVSGIPEHAASDSIDEESYYSSKANSWSRPSSEDEVARETHSDAVPYLSAGKGKFPVGEEPSASAIHAEDVDPNDDEDEDEYEPAADLEIIDDEPEYHPEPAGFPDVEDEDYSPPPADPFTSRGHEQDARQFGGYSSSVSNCGSTIRSCR